MSAIATETRVKFDRNWLEGVILLLAEDFNIKVTWNRDVAVITGVSALLGGAIGGYVGSRVGVAIGAGVGGIAGFGVAQYVSLKEVWYAVKEKLKELLYIVFNFLRRLDAEDYKRAFSVLMACPRNRTELVCTIVDFIAHKLDLSVISSITAA